MSLYIKPVYVNDRLVSLALCRSNDPLVDQHILGHFPPNEPGRDVKLAAVEFHGAASVDDVKWGTPINSDTA